MHVPPEGRLHFDFSRGTLGYIIVAGKTVLYGREDLFFGLHRFLFGKQDCVDVKSEDPFFLVFTDFGGTRANP